MKPRGNLTSLYLRCPPTTTMSRRVICFFNALMRGIHWLYTTDIHPSAPFIPLDPAPVRLIHHTFSRLLHGVYNLPANYTASALLRRWLQWHPVTPLPTSPLFPLHHKGLRWAFQLSAGSLITSHATNKNQTWLFLGSARPSPREQRVHV